MIYTTVSSNEVIAMVLSKTKLSDVTFADDILNALKEATVALKVRNTLKPTHKVLAVTEHSVAMPCGLQQIDAVVYGGCRLRLGLGVTDTRVSPFGKVDDNAVSVYFTDPNDPAYQNAQSYLLLRGDDIKLGTYKTSEEYYIPYPNFIQTSFIEGDIVLFYRTMPVDSEGYPLIPDEHNHKQACFWYIMGALALGGYRHNDPRMDFDYCNAYFERYARRAKNRAKYWSIDKRESVMQASVNLIPPRNYYESFMINSEQRKYVDK